MKDFNCEHLACAEAQEKDKCVWKNEVLALDTTREARIAQKEAQIVSMDQKLYELEVERTNFLGNMTFALLLLASSMDALTRLCIISSFFELGLILEVLVFVGVFLCSRHFGCVSSSLANPPLPSFLLVKFFLHSQGLLALGLKNIFINSLKQVVVVHWR